MLSLDNLASKFSTNINVEEPAASLGLSDTDATSLLEIHGRNELPAPKQVSPILLFLAKVPSLARYPSILTVPVVLPEPLPQSPSTIVLCIGECRLSRFLNGSHHALYFPQFLDPLMLLLSLAGGLSFLAFGLDQSQKSNWIIGTE